MSTPDTSIVDQVVACRGGTALRITEAMRATRPVDLVDYWMVEPLMDCAHRHQFVARLHRISSPNILYSHVLHWDELVGSPWTGADLVRGAANRRPLVAARLLLAGVEEIADRLAQAVCRQMVVEVLAGRLPRWPDDVRDVARWHDRIETLAAVADMQETLTHG